MPVCGVLHGLVFSTGTIVWCDACLKSPCRACGYYLALSWHLSLSFRRVLGCALGLTAVDGCNVTRATMPPRGRGGSLHIQAEDIFSAFTLFDTNGDGVITRSEFVRILTRAGEGCTPLDEEQAIKLWNDFLQDVGAAHGHARAPSPFD